MKKVLLSVVMLITWGAIASGQIKWFDYDTLSMNFAGFGGAAFEVADNPNPGGINTSDKVGKETTGNETWSGIYAPDHMGGTIDFSSSKVFTLKVYSDNTGEILLKIEQFDDQNNFVELRQDYTTSGTWAELTFDFTELSPPSGELGKFVLFFDMDVGDAGEEWYFDDLTGADFTAASGDVDVTFQITDADQAASTIEVEISTDPGNKVALTHDGGGVWTTTVPLAGSTHFDKIEYTYTIYVDGNALETGQDIEFAVPAGSDPITVTFTFGSGYVSVAEATNFSGSSPNIDGVIDALWDGATQYDIKRVFATDVIEDENDLAGYFKVGYDALGLYVLVVLTADDYFYVNPGVHGENWEQDLIEVYLDMNVSDLKDGDGPNPPQNGHYQIQIHNKTGWVPPEWFEFGDWGFTSTSETEGEAYSAIHELYVDWYDVLDKDGNPYTPGDGNIGLDVQLSDNDGASGTARNRLIWVNDAYPENWDNMDGAGELIVASLGTGISEFRNSVFEIYPNPATDRLFIKNSSELRSVAVVNIIGAEVMNIASDGSDQMSLDISELTSGVYIVRFTDLNGMISNSKFIVK